MNLLEACFTINSIIFKVLPSSFIVFVNNGYFFYGGLLCFFLDDMLNNELITNSEKSCLSDFGTWGTVEADKDGKI